MAPDSDMPAIWGSPEPRWTPTELLIGLGCIAFFILHYYILKWIYQARRDRIQRMK